MGRAIPEPDVGVDPVSPSRTSTEKKSFFRRLDSGSTTLVAVEFRETSWYLKRKDVDPRGWVRVDLGS